ncbi:MAG: hypothetical protein BJ554DRAFT_3312 [Olpidium bornovanus]|uniref:Tudor domain-containing protein n=1 Tax=Olpidium bornovanus TaxID=278681 RepID=A0A8H8DFY2_9FUNG|nr:MAG: hypothetical protein BJ554DRAFT_3312 [Olpidium bornovanus]
MKEFSVYHSSEKSDPSWKPKKGELVSAKYTSDDSWYRATIRRLIPASNEAEILYVDYGNSEVVSLSRIRPMPAEFGSLPPQSRAASLAFVKIPGEETGYGNEACRRFHELVRDKQLVANVEARIAGGMHLSLFDPATSTDRTATLNGELVASGLATVDTATGHAKANPDVIETLAALQEKAKKSRLGMWEYGDITADEEDQQQQPRNAWGRRS